jgi:hypothetical protein
MQINREQFAKELQLRQYIRKAIQIVENKRKNALNEAKKQEETLRGFIRQLISEASVQDSEEGPHKSTGINILEDLLKKIIPIIEIDFKKLTTSEEQRGSYRAHMLTGIKNLLAPASWEVLSNPDDKELFYDYLLTNLKLYFDKFEDELKANLPEPTTPEYEKAKGEGDL